MAYYQVMKPEWRVTKSWNQNGVLPIHGTRMAYYQVMEPEWREAPLHQKK